MSTCKRQKVQLVVWYEWSFIMKFIKLAKAIIIIIIKLEKVFVKHYAPNHIPDPKGEWSVLTYIDKHIQTLISQPTYLL